MGMVWYCFWLWLSFEKPRFHPAISTKELKYIEKSLGNSVNFEMPKISTTPWHEISRSMPVIAIIVANFCRSWNFYLLVLYQSKYLKHRFGFDLAEVSSEDFEVMIFEVNCLFLYFILSGGLVGRITTFVDDNNCPFWRNAGWSFTQKWHYDYNKCEETFQLRRIRSRRIFLLVCGSFDNCGELNFLVMIQNI